MKAMSALMISLFTSSFAHATSPVREMTCLNAGGFYGNFAIRQNQLTIEVIGQQGYAYELSTELGAASGQEAARIDLSFSQQQCVAGLNGALHCQGSVQAVVHRYTEPRVMMTAFNADVVVRPTNPGHEITIALEDPGSGRQGKAIVNFGDCQIR